MAVPKLVASVLSMTQEFVLGATTSTSLNDTLTSQRDCADWHCALPTHRHHEGGSYSWSAQRASSQHCRHAQLMQILLPLANLAQGKIQCVTLQKMRGGAPNVPDPAPSKFARAAAATEEFAALTQPSGSSSHVPRSQTTAALRAPIAHFHASFACFALFACACVGFALHALQGQAFASAGARTAPASLASQRQAFARAEARALASLHCTMSHDDVEEAVGVW